MKSKVKYPCWQKSYVLWSFALSLCWQLFNTFRNAFFCVHAAEVNLPVSEIWVFKGVCFDTAWQCSCRKPWSNFMLLVASWLIRFTRNFQTLKPQIIISHKKSIYYAINFVPSRFSKVKSLTAIKLLLHILIYFSLQLGNVSKTYFGVLCCHCFSYIKKNICSHLFHPLLFWNLCHFPFCSWKVRDKKYQ